MLFHLLCIKAVIFYHLFKFDGILVVPVVSNTQTLETTGVDATQNEPFDCVVEQFADSKML
ncbi:MAG: hypothetical protein QMA99_05360 [Flavobacterium sp.]